MSVTNRTVSTELEKSIFFIQVCCHKRRCTNKRSQKSVQGCKTQMLAKLKTILLKGKSKTGMVLHPTALKCIRYYCQAILSILKSYSSIC